MGCGASKPDHAPSATVVPEERERDDKEVRKPEVVQESKKEEDEVVPEATRIETGDDEEDSTLESPSGKRAHLSHRRASAAGGAVTKRRRGSVLGESYDPVASAAADPGEVGDVKSDLESRVISEALARNPILAHLTPSSVDGVVRAMKRVVVPAGREIIKQGDEGDRFYVLEQGLVNVFVDGRQVTEISAGGSFGELALLHNAPRAATVVASLPCTLWALGRRTFQKHVVESAAKALEERLEFLRRVPNLRSVDGATLARLAEALKPVVFRPGDVIVERGERAGVFYMVQKGTARVLLADETPEQVLREHNAEKGGEGKARRSSLRGGSGDGASPSPLTLGPGGFFGEETFLASGESEKRRATVVALEPDKSGGITCLALPEEHFRELQEPLVSPMRRTFTASDMKRGKLAGKKGDVTSTPDTTLRRVGSDGDATSGGTSSRELGRARTMMPSSIRSKGSGDKEEEIDIAATPRAVSRTMSSGGAASGGGKKVASGGEKEEEVRKAEGSTPSHAPTAVRSSSSRGLSSSSALSLEELERVATLGSGAFGLVYLVHHRESGRVFALKEMAKARIVATKQQRNVVREKTIMATLRHPFILKLYRTFRDKNRLSLLLEVCHGGDLFGQLSRVGGTLSGRGTRFYAACIALALAYMHRRNVIYRDLKPENIVIDRHGFPRVCDLGFAKVVKSGGRTFTLCGTPEYLAPEIVRGVGHREGADWWALGVLIYELIVGYSPFADHDANAAVTIYKQILRGRYEWPRNVGDRHARDIVSKLLIGSPSQRLGTLRNGARDVLNHSFFRDVDLRALLRKQVRPPIVPKVRSDLDTGNIDFTPHEDGGPGAGWAIHHADEEYESDGTGWADSF